MAPHLLQAAGALRFCHAQLPRGCSLLTLCKAQVARKGAMLFNLQHHKGDLPPPCCSMREKLGHPNAETLTLLPVVRKVACAAM